MMSFVLLLQTVPMGFTLPLPLQLFVDFPMFLFVRMVLHKRLNVPGPFLGVGITHCFTEASIFYLAELTLDYTPFTSSLHAIAP